MTAREREMRAAYPGYFGAALEVEPPAEGLPEEFWIITACDPDGVKLEREANEKRTGDFRKRLVETGRRFFPVTGYDPRPGKHHREPGFGVVMEERDALETGRSLKQIAIYQVTNGEVRIVFCGEPVERFFVKPWAGMIAS